MSAACAWCRAAIAPGSRSDARYCSKACRQAAHRAKVSPAAVGDGGRPLSLAYADPPYPGQAFMYRDHPDYAGEVDHAALIERLAGFDGWALSTSARALPQVLELASRLEARPVRVAAWVRGGRPHPRAAIESGWEPVLYVPSRRARGDGRPTVDALVGPTPRARTTLPSYVVGAKPPQFSVWMFGLLVARPGDTLADLFPGSGLVARAWAAWSAAMPDDSLWALEAALSDPA